jgi:hypothetical protein
MSAVTDSTNSLERSVATLLNLGTLLGCILIGAGMMLSGAGQATAAGWLESAGVAAFVVLPVIRLLALVGGFLRRGERRFALISLAVILIILASIAGQVVAKTKKPAADSWNFVVSGDSRNCGDVIMPAIAVGAHAHRAAFYWHLGDLRAIYDFDQDYRQLNPGAPIIDYLKNAWFDFQRSQLEPFGDTPVFLGIGNHETVPPKTREQFTLTFADWLNAPDIRTQRLRDDAHDHQVRTYYHWQRDGIEFVNLDNASPDQFDAAQLKWVHNVLKHASDDPAIRAVVVGMHEALPQGIAISHSMSDSPTAETSGIAVYHALLTVQKTKPVHVLASHSHFVMEGVFETDYWREHGGVLPGWIVGTAGAVRYPLPADANRAKFAKTQVYGYLLATVTHPRTPGSDPIQFAFQELSESDTPAEVVERYTPEFVHGCYAGNIQD